MFLVDTPGLFGSKEDENGEKYRDITKKYASEAHIVLYIMDPNNPIKESHKATLQWLFKDLNLLERTVFVLGRFDEEVDIEEEEEYIDSLNMKKEDIIDSLKNFGILKDNQEVIVVGISANPFDKGIDYWLKNKEEYKKLSHIELLQEATANKIIDSGKKNEIILAAQKSVVADVIGKELPKVDAAMTNLKNDIIRLSESSEEMKNESISTKKTIESTRINLKEYVSDVFTDLILQIKSTSIDTIGEFFERNIGREGIVLENNIQNEFERQLGTALNKVSQLQKSYNLDISHFNDISNAAINKGIKMSGNFIKNLKIDNKLILGARDVLKLPIKFKPWEAVKLAKGFNDAVPIIGDILGIGVDVMEMYSKSEKEEQFKKAVNTIVDNFEKQRKEMLDFLNNVPKFYKTYFQSYLDLNKNIEDIENQVKDMNKKKEDFEKWKDLGNVIEVEFKELTQSQKYF